MDSFLKFSKVFTMLFLLFSCGSSKQAPSINKSLLGKWEGCDGRVVYFTQNDDKIIGTYIKPAGLSKYGFEEGEVGFELEAKGNGLYEGKVKWRILGNDNEQWRNVSITVEGNTYYDKGSDACSSKAIRIVNN